MKKAYSRKGDRGITCHGISNLLSKDDPKIIALGKIDSLQAALDSVLLHAKEKIRTILNTIQKKLWQLGGELSGSSKTHLVCPIIKKDLTDMEYWIDALGQPPNQFIHFNTPQSIQYNECRVRCRELETYLVPLLKNKLIRPVAYQYINRLSSLFFMLAYRRMALRKRSAEQTV